MIQTDKLVRSFGIVAISLSFISILLVLSRNVPVEEDVINLGNWKFTALTVVAPKTKLPDHLPAILSNRTSNSSSSCIGWLVKTMLSSELWRVLYKSKIKLSDAVETRKAMCTPWIRKPIRYSMNSNGAELEQVLGSVCEHYTFLRNCPPTPSLSQHYITLTSQLGKNVGLGEGVGGQFPRNV